MSNPSVPDNTDIVPDKVAVYDKNDIPHSCDRLYQCQGCGEIFHVNDGKELREKYEAHQCPVSRPRDLQEDLARLLNGYSRESASNTPDFILAEYMLSCLKAFEAATKKRDDWYGPRKSEI